MWNICGGVLLVVRFSANVARHMGVIGEGILAKGLETDCGYRSGFPKVCSR